MPPRLNIPPVTRILLIALVSESILSAAIRYRQWNKETAAELHVVVPYLSLVPQLSFVYPWTFLTTTLVENNVFTLGIAGLTLFYGGRYLERAWTSKEFAKFIVVASLIPNLLTFGTLVLLFAVTGDMSWTLSSINGTIPLQISFLIAFSQLVPTHTVTLFKGILSLRVPRFPALHLLTILTLTVLQFLSLSSVFLVYWAFLTSWTYLRFYKSAFPDLDSHQSTLRGDASETFAFAEFFPGPLKPLVAGVADAIFNLLVTVNICTPFSAADVSASRGESSFIQQRSTPGGARAEAERRRALALKALDQRLHAATNKVAPPVPTGPSVATQPQVGTQTAMTSQPSGMLGETNYVPEGHGDEGGKGGS